MFTLLKLIPKPYFIIGVVVILISTHFSAMMFGRSIANNAAKAKLQKETEAKLVEMRVLLAENVRLNNEVRAIEASHAEKLASFSQTYQEQLKNVRLEKDRFINGVRSGAVKLRFPASTSNGKTNTQTSNTTLRCDATSGAELPREVTEFLYSEASRADEIVEQLSACQSIVREDRRLCGALN
jgi:hypothetical protein